MPGEPISTETRRGAKTQKRFDSPILFASLRLCAFAFFLFFPSPARAADTPAPPPVESEPANLVWALFQLIPGSDVVVWNGAVRYGARWQVTPLLYSFGRNRKLSPWRSLLIEPTMRESGSIGLVFSPEVLAGPLPAASSRWILRTSLEGHVPLVTRGETLSASVGASWVHAGDRNGAGFEVGLHAMGGMLGVRATYCPTPGLRIFTVGAELRIF